MLRTKRKTLLYRIKLCADFHFQYAHTIDNVDYHNIEYLKKFAEINDIKNIEMAKELIKFSKDEKYKDKFKSDFV